MAKSIGKRIALFRKRLGLTQEALAERVAISRVAISHIEMDLTIPSERTITIMAGLFKLTPFELVRGTTYPRSKAERLPVDACCYTKLELDLELIENDLLWLEYIENLQSGFITLLQLKYGIREKWLARLFEWEARNLNELEKVKIRKVSEALKNIAGTYS